MRALLMACVVAGWAAFPALTLAQDQPAPKDPPPPAQVGGPEAQPQEEKLLFVKMTTSMGDIVLELNPEKAPISVKNFMAYVEKGFYNGTIFHRVMPDFMIQGGGFTPDMQQKPTEPTIKNEWQNGLKHTRGALAMARMGGRPDSASAQFFINVKDNPGLDQPQPDGAGYAVFGRVLSGMDVVDRIKIVKTATKGPHGDVPVESVTISKVVKITADEAKAGSSEGDKK